MKRYSHIALVVIAVLLMSAMPGHADRFRGGGGHGGGHGWGPGWGPVIGLGLGLGLLGLSYPYYGYPYYPGYSPAPVIEQPPAEMYMQPAPEEAEQQSYWYYCQDSEGYYPYVKRCPGGWIKVVPPPPRQ